MQSTIEESSPPLVATATGWTRAEPPAYGGNQELTETFGVVTTSAVTNLYPRVETPRTGRNGAARRNVQ